MMGTREVWKVGKYQKFYSPKLLPGLLEKKSKYFSLAIFLHIYAKKHKEIITHKSNNYYVYMFDYSMYS